MANKVNKRSRHVLHAAADDRPVCPCVVVPDGQSVQLLAFVPVLYLLAGHTSQVPWLFAFRKEPAGQTRKGTKQYFMQ